MKRTSQSRTRRTQGGGPGRGDAPGGRASRGRDGGPARPSAARSGPARSGTTRPGPTRPGPGRTGRPERDAGSRPVTQRPSGPRPAARATTPEKLLARQPWSALRALLPGDAGEVETRLHALREYARMLLDWNRGVSNLVSRNDEPRLVERHIRESIEPAKLLAEHGCRRYVDFGSGAGLPAIPLALCAVGEHWTLVESRRNKTLFLRKAKQDMGLKHIDVITGRLEVLVDEPGTAWEFDGFTSRATATVGPTLELAARVVSKGGRAFLWKGSSFQQEIDTTRSAWGDSWRQESVRPIGGGPNVVVVFERM